MSRRALVCAVFLITVVLSGVAQEQNPSSDSSSSVTLRTTTHMVVLDVVVTNASGKHASDLNADDFVVNEDGVKQTIVSFEKSGTHKGAPTKGGQPEQESASGTPQTILVLDELDTEWIINAQARQYLKKYFATHGPRLEQPTALLVLTNEGLQMLCNYTQDTRALTSALGQHRTALPYHLTNGEGRQGAYDRLGIAMTALHQIAQASTERHNRKNLVWIGQNIVGTVFHDTTLGGVASGTTDFSTEQKARNMVQELANSLLAARISVYTVDPVGLYFTASLNDPYLLTTNGDLIFENIAPETGGKIFRNINDVAFLVDKSVHDGASYYTLAYYPSNKNWDGKFRNIKVTVDRPGLEARTRLGYYALAEPEETPDEAIDLALSLAVRNPVPYTMIPTQVSVKAGETGNVREVAVSVDRSALYWAKLPNGDLRAEITLVTASVRNDNRVLKYKVREFESVVGKKKVSALAGVPVVFEVRADVPAKTDHLRIVVRDAQNERLGTADLLASELRASN